MKVKMVHMSHAVQRKTPITMKDWWQLSRRHHGPLLKKSWLYQNIFIEKMTGRKRCTSNRRWSQLWKDLVELHRVDWGWSQCTKNYCAMRQRKGLHGLLDFIWKPTCQSLKEKNGVEQNSSCLKSSVTFSQLGFHFRESMGYCQEEDETPVPTIHSYQSNLGFHNTPAAPQDDCLYATLHWCSHSCKRVPYWVHKLIKFSEFCDSGFLLFMSCKP